MAAKLPPFPGTTGRRDWKTAFDAIKKLLQCLVNIVAGLFFSARGAILWQYAGLVAVGSIVGALAGAWLARRIPAKAFRIFIVVFGLVMAAYMRYRAPL